MMKKLKRVFIFLILILAVIMAGNIDTSIHQGTNGRYRDIHMPLYAKWIQFLARHYEYARLEKEITHGYADDEARAIAILKWTKENIKDVPSGMPIVDDHILNIIIKGYGTPVQFQDVFTLLCSYDGMPAFWDKFYDKNHKIIYAISFAKIKGEWRVFDAYQGIYFRKDNGRIASVEDIMMDPYIVQRDVNVNKLYIAGVPYKDFYYNLDLKQVKEGITLRPYRQMPLHRIVYEMKKFFGMEKHEKIK